MVLVNIISGGGGGFATETVEIRSVPIQIVIDGTRYAPAAVRGIDMENDGDVETITDQCGRTESERRSDKNWKVIIDGIVTAEEYQTRDSGSFVQNLTLEELQNIKNAGSIRLEGEMFDVLNRSSEPLVLDNVVVGQSNDLVSVDVGAGEQIAYEFQLQLRQAQP